MLFKNYAAFATLGLVATSVAFPQLRDPTLAELDKRQTGLCHHETKLVQKVGKLYKHKQLTDPHSWPSDASTTYEESFSVSADVGGGSFASVRLGVSKSVTFGQNHHCPAEDGKTSCVYVAVGYMQYLVHECPNLCGTTKCNEAYSIKAPLKERDVTYYCRYDEGPAGKNCPRMGYEFWKQTEPLCAGGGPKVKRC